MHSTLSDLDGVFVVVEPGAVAAAPLERALSLAEDHQARLCVGSVLDDRALRASAAIDGYDVSGVCRAIKTETEARVAAVLSAAGATRPHEMRWLNGTPFLAITREVLRGGRWIVVKAAEDPGWSAHLLGSDDLHLLRKCPAPVWLLRTNASPTVRRILATVDVDEAYPVPEQRVRENLNEQVLATATALALAEPAELHVVAAWEPIAERLMGGPLARQSRDQIEIYVDKVRRRHEGALDELVSRVVSRSGEAVADLVGLRKHLTRGQPRVQIAELSHRLEIDLLVMGTVARCGIPGLLMGNTAEAILRQVDCAVLALKPDGFVSPVRLDA